MKPNLRTLFNFIAVFTATWAANFSVFAQSNVVILTLEHSSNGLGSWEAIKVTTNTVSSANAFFRMRVALATPTPTPTPPPVTNGMVTVQGGVLPPSSRLAGTAVSTFRIGKYEVTWEEWQEVRTWAVANGYNDLAGLESGSGSRPVASVSWYESVKWINAKSEKEGLVPVYQVNGAVFRNGTVAPSLQASANGYRLPTESEWEWAARGGVLSQGYIYSGSNDADAVAWYNDNSATGMAVGTKVANELGIHDMSGNVAEWCEDPVSSWRRIRGGSWLSSAGNIAINASPPFGSPTDRGPSVGLRLARNAP